jgi:hypothetical protein
MPTYPGTVKGGRIVLPEGVALADGQHVEVRVIPSGDPVVADGVNEADREDEIQRHLFEIGLLNEIKRPGPAEPPGDRRPINVRGRPISEMIIEERR